MRVVLTHPQPDDERDFLAAMRASRKLHRPWIYPPLTGADYRRYLASLNERKIGYLGRRREDDAIVGWANVSEIVRGGFQNAFLGYSGIGGHAGQGYMTETLQLVLRDAFTCLKLHRLEANIQPDKRAFAAPRPALRIRARGLLPALSEGGRSLARPRALGDSAGDLAGAQITLAPVSPI